MITCGAAWPTPAIGILPPVSWAFEPTSSLSRYDPARAQRAARRGRLSATLTAMVQNRGSAVAESFEHRVQPAAVGGHPAGSRAQSGSSSTSAPTSSRRCMPTCLSGNFQMFTLQWVGVSDPDMLRRVFHSSQMPPDRVQPRLLRESASRSADRSRHGLDRSGERLQLYSRSAAHRRRRSAVHQPLVQDQRRRWSR